MLDEAGMSDGFIGNPSDSTPYLKNIGGEQFNIWDIAGPNEGCGGRVQTATAIEDLWWLINRLENGVSLLVFVIRGRITERVYRNYKLFYETFCEEAVRIVLVIASMDNEKNQEGCWTHQEGFYTDYRMKFDGYAYVTAFKGKEGRHQEEYDRTKTMIEKLIVENSKGQPWKVDRESWFQRVVGKFFQFRATDGDAKVLYQALQINGMNKKEARSLATQALKRHKEEKKQEKLNLTR
jgi:hypothetical protein